MNNEENRTKAIELVNECNDLLVHIFQAYIDEPKGVLFMTIRSCMNGMQLAWDQIVNMQVDNETLAMINSVKDTLISFKDSKNEAVKSDEV